MTSRGYIREYFRQRAIKFPDFYSKRPLLPIESYIVDQIPQGDSNVLDLCCGGGEIALATVKRGATVTGIDYVWEMVELAVRLFREEGYSGSFYTGDATALPPSFGASFTHVICAGSSLNSMTNEDARLVMLEVARVLKPGGTVYYGILNPVSLRSVAAVGKGILQRAPIWSFYSRNRYGIEADGQVPRGMFYVIPPWKMRRYMKETGLMYRSENWNIGFMGYQAAMTLLIGRKK